MIASTLRRSSWTSARDCSPLIHRLARWNLQPHSRVRRLDRQFADAQRPRLHHAKHHRSSIVTMRGLHPNIIEPPGTPQLPDILFDTLGVVKLAHLCPERDGHLRSSYGNGPNYLINRYDVRLASVFQKY